MKQTLKLMADYECFPLWESSGQYDYANVNPIQLNLSDSLTTALYKWAAQFDATLNHEYPPDSGFSTAEGLDCFESEGRRLCHQLQIELGNKYNIVYYSYKLRKTIEYPFTDEHTCRIG